MSETFRLPDLGEGVSEGEIIAWLVERGDHVEEDQPLVEVETDKALVEIPSPYVGRVETLHVEEGAIVEVGTELVSVAVDGETDQAVTGQDTEEVERGEAAPAPFARPSTRRLAREHGIELSAIDGTGPGGRITDDDVRARIDDEAEPAPASPEASAKEPAEGVLATPATRRLAAELGVDLAAVPVEEGSDGVAVTEEDVRASAAHGGRPSEGERREPYRGVRRTIGERMKESWQTIPHATHYDEVDATALVELRAQIKPLAAERDIRVTYLPFVMVATVRALREVPTLNASLDEANEEIVFRDDYHLGVATDTDVGLMVPVVRDVQELGLFELSAAVAEMVEAARDRTIDLEDLQDGTFTITNIGGIGGHYATPIINPPQVAILALGAIQERPRVVDGQVEPRSVLPLSLSFDHRVVDGAQAARFTNELKNSLRQPARLLVE